MRLTRKWSYLLATFSGICMAVTLGLYYVWPNGYLYTLITRCNYLGVIFGEGLAPIFFDRRRIAPSQAEARFFEGVLIVAAAVQGLLVGSVIDQVQKYHSNRRRRANSGG